MTATKVDDPANGTLTLNSNGTFTYTPDTDFEGVDSFTYTASDGTNTSVTATAQITVGDGLTGRLNGNERGASFLHDGALTFTQPLGSGINLAYRSDTIPVALVPIEMLIADGTTIPDSITANLSIAGASSGDITFNNTGLQTGEPLRFVLRARTESVATGMYDWTMTATLDYSSSSLTRTYTGSHAIVNRTDTEFGSGWWVEGLDRIYDSTTGALLVRGDGLTYWFEKSGSTYEKAEGDLTFSTLVKNGGGDFTLTDKWGDEWNFDSDGYITDIQKLNNTNASFTFTYDTSDRISKITDEFNREFTFTYHSASGKLDSINDFFGRETDITIDGSNRLTSIVLSDETFTGYTAPEWTFAYTTIGGEYFVDQVTDPDNNTTEYLYTLATRRIREIQNADHTTGDPSSWKLFPTIGEGFTHVGNVDMLAVADMDARYVDEEGNTFRFTTDRFGNLTSLTDPYDEVTTFEYDDQSLLYRLTGADPDGDGNLTSPVTAFGYNSLGDLLITKYPDGETTTATYHATLHRVTSVTNELSKTESFTYFPDGDLDTYTDLEGNDWSYTYDSYGNVLTETTPDPDGGESKYSEITTTYTYDPTYYRRMTRVTWDNTDYQDYTYTTSDQVQTFTDELGFVTSYEYDPLDRLIKMTLPDPDDDGPLLSPVYEYEYGSNLLLEFETDPLGNVTEYEYNERNWLTKITLPDPDGTTNTTLSSPEIDYDYNKLGQLIEEIRPEFNGVSISYIYDDNGRLKEVNGPVANQDTTYTYDALGRLTEMTDPSGRTVNYEYDARNRMTKFIDHDPDGAGGESGPTTVYEYDAAGRMIKITDPLGRETGYSYFDIGWLDEVTRPDPDGSGSETAPVWAYEYDKLGRLIKTTDPADRVTENEYNIFGQVTKFIDVDPDGALGANPPETDYVYNAAGWLTSVTEPGNLETSYSYDDLGRLLSITLPDPDEPAGPLDSPVYSRTYDAAGNVLTTTDPLSNVTTYEYDNLNRVILITQPTPNASADAPEWIYTYNDRMLLDSITDPMLHETSYGYDAAGRMTTVTDPLSNVTTYTYDLLNRTTDIQSPDPDGPTGPLSASITSYTFDIYSRITEIEDANDEIITYQYDIAGQLLSLTDQSGNITSWAYDNLGRKVMETDELGYTESYYYNELDRLIRKVDRESRTILFGFDSYDTTEYWYEHAAGTTPYATVATTTQGSTGVNEVQTVTLTDATSGTIRLSFNGQTTAPLDYDATASEVETALEDLEAIDNVSVTLAGSVYTVTFLGALAGTDVASLQGDVLLADDGTEQGRMIFTYDEAWNLIEIDDSWADYTFTVDDLGRVTKTVEDIVGFSTDITLDYTYDANGNRKTMAATIGIGTFGDADYENTYVYDDLNRLTRIEQTDQGENAVADKLIKFAYNALGQLTYVERFENLIGTDEALRTAYTYDGANRMNALQHRDVDGVGHSSQLAEYDYTYDDMGRIESIDSTQDGVSDYTYDSLGQLTHANHATGRTDESYTFDETGNRIGGDYVVSAKNRTDESTDYEYEYDRNGNRIKRLDTSDNSYELYTFDHRNRLTDVDFYNSSDTLLKTIDYAYDAFNRMVRRTFDADGPGGNSPTDQFFAGFDGIHPTLEFDDDGGDDVSHRYLWGIQSEQLLADEQVTTTSSEGAILWALADQVGTIRDIGRWDSTNSEFEVANHREYDSFGNLISETDSSVDLVYSFTGKWTESETGYTHHLNRWFDPVIGKWISEDPIGFAAGDTNISRYVTNRVTSRIDSTGLTEESNGGGGSPVGGKQGSDDDNGVGQTINTTGGPNGLEIIFLRGDRSIGLEVGQKTIPPGANGFNSVQDMQQRIRNFDSSKDEYPWHKIDGDYDIEFKQNSEKVGYTITGAALAALGGIFVFRVAIPYFYTNPVSTTYVAQEIVEGAAEVATNTDLPPTLPGFGDAALPVKRGIDDLIDSVPTRGSNGGQVVAPKGGTEKIFKAPQPGKGQKQLKDGFDPADFAEGDQRAYFAKQRELAEEYAKHYGDGVLEVEIPKDVYDARIRPHEVPYQGGPQVELPIPHKDFDVLNDAQRRLHGGGG